jgi:predicted transcriptional regulator
MKGLRRRRELAGLSQISLAQKAKVSRMRLQLAEAGQVALRPKEIQAINRTLRGAMEQRAAQLHRLLASAQVEVAHSA